MKYYFVYLAAALFFLTGCSSLSNKRSPASELNESVRLFENIQISNLPVKQRVGLFLESRESQFQGCVIYLEGLGDSIRNHEPLFKKMNSEGFRVLSFDYLGQGGSEGQMSWTRLDATGSPYPTSPNYEIGNQARWVWKKFSERKDPIFQRSCEGKPKIVMGWSTGGLAAYKLASEKWADAVVMIAPGISPKMCVGSAGSPSVTLKCYLQNIGTLPIITPESLSTENYNTSENPHVDPIYPNRPLDAKFFSLNLLSTSHFKTPFWTIDKSIKGLVFLSGKNDTYVDSAQTEIILKKQAAHFEVLTYHEALHEIDNERPAIRTDMQNQIVIFLKKISLAIPNKN